MGHQKQGQIINFLIRIFDSWALCDALGMASDSNNDNENNNDNDIDNDGMD